MWKWEYEVQLGIISRQAEELEEAARKLRQMADAHLVENGGALVDEIDTADEAMRLSGELTGMAYAAHIAATCIDDCAANVSQTAKLHMKATLMGCETEDRAAGVA